MGKIVIRKGLSLRTIPRACERESEAIPSKAATALNNVRDSSSRESGLGMTGLASCQCFDNP